MPNKWHEFETKWRKAQKTKRAGRALGSAAVYGFATGLSGGTGRAILLGGLLFIGAGLALPDKNQKSHERLSLAAAAVLYLAGVVIFVRPLAFPEHARPAQAGEVKASVADDADSETDASYAARGLVPQPPVRSAPTGEKAGIENLRLVITNGYHREINVTDIQVVGLRQAPPLQGTLYRNTAQGAAPNDLMGVDLGSARPVVRQMTAADGLADPFFAGSHLYIKARQSEVISLTMFAGTAQSFSWGFRVTYDAGSGLRTAPVTAPVQLLRLTGYVHSYGRVFDQEGTVWTAQPATNYCRSTGSIC
jgi:hypothetical protein